MRLSGPRWSRPELRAIFGTVVVLSGVMALVVWWRAYRAPPEADVHAARIDLNRAPVWVLEILPGMSATQAAAVVAYRQRHGPFTRAGDLADVPGIHAQDVQRWAPFVRAGAKSLRKNY